ncbi:MAG: site-specific integrase [Rhizobiaceae bacterium]
MRLTDLQISKLKAPDRGQKTYFDNALPGFGLRVSQGGAKSFVVMYGKERKLKTLGRYPSLGLKEARIAAKRIQSDQALFKEVLDPSIIPITFAKARKRFLAETATRTKASTTKAYRWLLERHFSFDKSLQEVNRSDVMGVLEGLGSTPSERQHAFVAIRTLMNWCVRHGLIKASPVPRLTFQMQSRSRILSDQELKAVWSRAEEVSNPYGTIVQLLVLTGQRRGEIAGLRRSWINDDMIVFPAGFTKNKREHRLPLGPKASEFINAIPGDTDLLFPARGRKNAPFSGWSKSKREFDKPLDIEPYTLHDLRRTYSSKMAELGVPIYVTEKLLNHVSGTVSGIAAIYNRYSYMEEMKEAVMVYEGSVSKKT